MKTIPPAGSVSVRHLERGTYQDQTPKLELEVRVADDVLQNELKGFDKKEQAFALLPKRTENGEVQWERKNLEWKEYQSGTSYHYWNDATHSASRQDVHKLDLRCEDIDIETVSQFGVAFGLDTNVGTLWLQTPDDNYKPYK